MLSIIYPASVREKFSFFSRNSEPIDDCTAKKMVDGYKERLEMINKFFKTPTSPKPRDFDFDAEQISFKIPKDRFQPFIDNSDCTHITAMFCIDFDTTSKQHASIIICGVNANGEPIGDINQRYEEKWPGQVFKTDMSGYSAFIATFFRGCE